VAAAGERGDVVGGEVEGAAGVRAPGTGLRPEEWIALERRDVDRAAGVATIERVYTQGRLKQCAKSSRQRRRVPLRQRVLDALDAVPTRLDSPLLFPAVRGGYIELGCFRERQWKPALRAAGIQHRRIYDLRHTYATWSLAAGVSLFTLSRRMGTSLAMIDATYGHLAADAEDQERLLLDTYDEREAVGLMLRRRSPRLLVRELQGNAEKNTLRDRLRPRHHQLRGAFLLDGDAGHARGLTECVEDLPRPLRRALRCPLRERLAHLIEDLLRPAGQPLAFQIVGEAVRRLVVRSHSVLDLLVWAHIGHRIRLILQCGREDSNLQGLSPNGS
jgi:hypothetical protein